MSQQIDLRQAGLLLRLVKILSIECGVPLKKITLSSSVMRDLGIDGLDAWELMERLKQEFFIEMSEVDYEPYFGDEAGYNPIRLLSERLRQTAEKIPEITVADLLHVILDRRWNLKR